MADAYENAYSDSYASGSSGGGGGGGGGPTYGDEYADGYYDLYGQTGTSGGGGGGGGDPEPPPEPWVPAPEIPRVAWDLYVAYPLASGYLSALPHAFARKLTFNLNGPSTMSFSYDGRDDGCYVVTELAKDIVAEREGVPFYRGRVAGSSDSVGPTDHKVDFTTADYRSLLDRRITYLAVSAGSGGKEQSQLVWDLVQHTQAQPGGNLGITRGVKSISDGRNVFRYDVVPAGKVIGSTIDDISARAYGFDWEIDANRKLNTWQPYRGVYSGFTVVYGGNCMSFSRGVSPTDFANAVWVDPGGTTGGLAPATAFASDIATRAEGRYDLAAGQSSMQMQNQLDVTAQAVGILQSNGIITPAYTLKLSPGAWDPAHCWLGDSVRLIIQSGRLNVDAQYRVQQVSIDVDESGIEAVTITVGAKMRSASDRVRELMKRVEELARK